MRITIWLSIAVFVTTLFWPQLLSTGGLILCVLLACLFYITPILRSLLSLPLTAIFFTAFVYIILSAGILKQPHDYQITSNIFKDLNNGQHHNIGVKVKSLINDKNKGYFVANVISVNDQACYACPLIEMRWFKPNTKLQAGQIHEFKVRIKALMGKGNPGGFDRQKWRYSQHIAYVASIKEHIRVIDAGLSWRAYLYEQVLGLTQGLKYQGALLALTFADKSLLDKESKQAIKELGIAHLFAISGLHIGLLYLWALFIIRPIVNHGLPQAYIGWYSWRLLHLLSFIVCLFYGYLSGFSLPTQRALWMLLLFILIFANKRSVSRADILLVCLWFILLSDPLAILSSSLWLSFFAVGCVLLFIWAGYRPENICTTKSRWQRLQSKSLFYLKWLCLLQLLLTLLMLPIQLWFFSAISINSLLVNLFAIPLFSWLIIPLVMLAVLLTSFTEPLAGVMMRVCENLFELFFQTFQATRVLYLELAKIEIALLLSLVCLLLLTLSIWFISYRYKLSRVYLYLIPLAFMAVSVSALFEINSTNKQSWTVAIFDIGQGLAILVSSEDEHLLYDTGPSFPPHYISAEYVLAPYFEQQGIDKLNYLVVSHSDNDHAGGADFIREQFVVERAFSGEAKVMNGQDNIYQQCRAGMQLRLGKLTLEFLAPFKLFKNNNNNSCVLRIGDEHNKLLLTGDIHKNQEQHLIEHYQQGQLNADILLAPHHGSNTSSSSAFIKAVNPDWVVFTSGYQNQWGFPKKQVLQRYLDHQVQSLLTSDSGFIRFNMQNQHIKVKTYREDLASYWYHQQLIF